MNLSVVMPVFNAEKYLKESIESILNQTYQDFEFLILNDCSTDGSLDIINDFAAQDSRIQVFDFKENKKPAFIRSFAVKEAKTHLIAFADADDVYLPKRFETQVNYMQTHPEIDICGTWFKLFGTSIESQIIKHKPENQQIKARFLVDSHIGFPTAIVRKKVFETISFDKSYFPIEDYEFLAKATKQYTFYNLQKVLVNYRWHDTNVSHTANTKLESLHFKVRHKLFNLLFEKQYTFSESLIYLYALKYQTQLENIKLIDVLKAGKEILDYEMNLEFRNELEIIINEAREVYLFKSKKIDFQVITFLKKSCKPFYNSLDFKFKKRLYKKMIKNFL
ncbi:glycosyltransferase family 2 protein [Aurantibacter aestuarii]|uniref:Glycosyltransferase 2-like domain-containing protein n=1 Tax=Aurantibacter aestuarii TaxID=1266046 RepID=A0A2T1N9W0_9FLAO|nr:glycosyltransferase family 2 protein [Aurantibacter aestuarii]PSG88660.1 hypothetical protein C7H52_10225 [Aurantibacter aestuarii]